MPTYVYRNLNTGETLELKQSMRDEALTQHPETGEPIKRLVSAPAIAFKGSGFYANDSRSSGAGGPGKSEAAKTDSATSESASPDTSSPGKASSEKATSDPSSSASTSAAPSAKTDAPSKAPAASSAAARPPTGGRGE